LKLCGGHPFLLKLVGEAADMDYSVTAENTGLTIDDVEHVKCLVKEGLQRAFDKLSKRQHLILLAFSLFGRDAKLSALYNVRLRTFLYFFCVASLLFFFQEP